MGGGAGGNFGNTKGSHSNSDGNTRFKGKPGEIKNWKNIETKMGDDGRAIKERHHTDHGNPKYHSNPHDHFIRWDENGNPIFDKSKNYWNEKIPKFK